MYYVPYAYYEIRDGRIQFDSAYTRKKEVQENGIYLTHLFGLNGYCCAVIPKPANKRTYIVIDTSIKSERINGPANIRDTIGGTRLFQLDDNVPVSTTGTTNKWYRISLPVDLDASQFHSSHIQKGGRIYSRGIKAGVAGVVDTFVKNFNQYVDHAR